jgi:hypothetical protein
VIREAADDDGEPKRGERGEKQRRQDRREELGSDIHHSDGCRSNHNTYDKGNKDRDQDNEEPRPVKQQIRNL